jgi:hypothetical protein
LARHRPLVQFARYRAARTRLRPSAMSQERTGLTHPASATRRQHSRNGSPRPRSWRAGEASGRSCCPSCISTRLRSPAEAARSCSNTTPSVDASNPRVWARRARTDLIGPTKRSWWRRRRGAGTFVADVGRRCRSAQRLGAAAALPCEGTSASASSRLDPSRPTPRSPRTGQPRRRLRDGAEMSAPPRDDCSAIPRVITSSRHLGDDEPDGRQDLLRRRQAPVRRRSHVGLDSRSPRTSCCKGRPIPGMSCAA